MLDADSQARILKAKKKRLELLEEKKAILGYSADPSLDIEIEEIRGYLGSISNQFNEKTVAPDDRSGAVIVELIKSQSKLLDIIESIRQEVDSSDVLLLMMMNNYRKELREWVLAVVALLVFLSLVYIVSESIWITIICLLVAFIVFYTATFFRLKD